MLRRMNGEDNLPHYRNSDGAMVLVGLLMIGFISFIFGALIGGVIVWIF